MTQAFLQIAIPVLYVYDEGESPEQLPGAPMSILPVISRALKEHTGTPKVTVITGTPTPKQGLDEAFTHLALQYAHLEKASPEAGALLAAEFLAENFDPEAVLKHLQRIVKDQQRELAEEVENRFGAVPPSDGEDVGEGEAAAGETLTPETPEEAAAGETSVSEAPEEAAAGEPPEPEAPESEASEDTEEASEEDASDEDDASADDEPADRD